MEARRIDHFRAWWVWRKEAIGFVLAILALGALALLANPFAAVDNTKGKIVEFRKLGRKGSVEIYAVVDVDHRHALVRLDPTPDCQVGATVFVQKRRTLIGVRYDAPRGCR
jgi:hypothetical protein